VDIDFKKIKSRKYLELMLRGEMNIA